MSQVPTEREINVVSIVQATVGPLEAGSAKSCCNWESKSHDILMFVSESMPSNPVTMLIVLFLLVHDHWFR